jgi:4-hydroxy-tetrahydrodipicolinate synthase
MFKGSLVALITPMLADGAVDYEKLKQLIEFHIEAGSNGLVIAGTTGESATLTMSEHSELIKRSVDIIDGRIAMMAGTGANSTAEAIELTRSAKESGAEACLLVTPYYNKPTQEGLYQHHKAIAEAVDIDQFLYNVPGRTAVDMLPETVQRISEIKQVVGLKEATGDLERLRQVQELVADDFVLLCGDDASTRDFILQGGDGCISVTANVAPAKMAEMCRLALEGKEDEAEKIDQQLMMLHEKLFIESSPIPVKWAMSEMGFCDNTFRLPLTPLSEENYQPVKAAMRAAGIE